MDDILKYFPDLTEQQIRQFSMLGSLYKYWNEKINVISRKDIENLYIKHILHSLAIAKIIRFAPSTRVMDVGTGGGFPGIPLAIMNPLANFYMIDSIGKKIRVVNEIIQAVGLKNAYGINARAEQIHEQFDFIVSRAVTSFPAFYSWVNKNIQPVHKNPIRNGILYLKGGDIMGEIKDFKNKIRLFSISDFFNEEYFATKLIVYLPV